LYYDQYINWFNKLKGFTGDINNSNYGLNISDFERFFDKILKNVTKKSNETIVSRSVSSKPVKIYPRLNSYPIGEPFVRNITRKFVPPRKINKIYSPS
jgi:hypothetical protein